VKHAVLAVGIVLVQACSHTPSLQVAGPEWIDDRTGNLIAAKIRDTEEGQIQPEQIVLVESPWAALIVWNSEERHFHLFDNKHRTYVTTESWPCFLGALRSIPEGTSIQRFYKCSVPWDWAMPEEERAQLDQVMKLRRLDWRRLKDEELSTVMVCIHGGMKAGGVEFPPP